ncbi:amidohydrolase family protein [Allosaccharopolyspora coralli]|uniref:Amidohydrolase family protein n=1 Tax=Allosaccharopolyspora coralli TaxID=2665642 RepID=A0A5Q3Q675_9PSEU|nr:amidohydrolase family protein [Allosaccharopolyspora coralli]QGK70098.1 amidohydrolase family protein [Allosaccharopolyspora coralli]
MAASVRDESTAAPLVDHHCHGLLRENPDPAMFERHLGEGDGPGLHGATPWNAMLGMGLRRWCPPVLDLPAHSEPAEYLHRRVELGADEVNRRFLRASGITRFLVDTGLLPDTITSPAELAALSGERADEVVRLEQVAEEVVRSGTSAERFAEQVEDALAQRLRGAVGVKSIAAYRIGLDFDPRPPSRAAVRAAADTWLHSGGRLAHPAIHRFLLWRAVEWGLPIQFHIGLGDTDLDLHRCDPLLLTEFLRATRSSGTPVVLLHNYPYHRHVGYLAHVFEHVFVDIGLAAHHVGSRAGAVLAETTELAPFGKLLFATDAFGLAELYLLGSTTFLRALDRFLDAGVAENDWTVGDAARIREDITGGTARRLYALD